MCYLVTLLPLKERIMLERCHKESFKTGAEISAIKELKIFLVQQEKNITLAADRDDSRGLDTYLYRIRKTWKERLVSILLVQILDAESILKADVNC